MFKIRTRRIPTREIVGLYYYNYYMVGYCIVSNIHYILLCQYQLCRYLQSVAAVVPAVRPRVQRAVTIFCAGRVDYYEPPLSPPPYTCSRRQTADMTSRRRYNIMYGRRIRYAGTSKGYGKTAGECTRVIVTIYYYE